MVKKFARSAVAAALASWAIRAYIRLVHGTSSWRFVGRDHFDYAAAEGKGVILAFWHGRLLMAPMVRAQTDNRVYMLISAHRDGEIIANAVKPFGIDFIRGSSANRKKPGKNKSGAPAVLQMVAALNEGGIIGLTPDGPRGPGEKVQAGIIRLAQKSGAPIVPAAYATSRGKHMGSWDRFWLAAPFSKGVYMAGEAIHVSPDLDAAGVESARKSVENALIAVTQQADALVRKRET